MHKLVSEAIAARADTLDPEALDQQVRLYRSAAQIGLTSTTARSNPTLMRNHNTLARRLLDRQDDYLRFTQDWRIPPDDNGSERDIRMIKLRQPRDWTGSYWRACTTLGGSSGHWSTSARQGWKLTSPCRMTRCHMRWVLGCGTTPTFLAAATPGSLAATLATRLPGEGPTRAIAEQLIAGLTGPHLRAITTLPGLPQPQPNLLAAVVHNRRRPPVRPARARPTDRAQ